MNIPVVYIMSNARRTVVYTGITTDIQKRIVEHASEKPQDGFCGRYNVFDLVYYEQHDTIAGAIAREKQIKGYARKKKNEIIERLNPQWKTLCIEL